MSDDEMREFLKELRREKKLKRLAPDMWATLKSISPILDKAEVALDGACDALLREAVAQAARMVREILYRVGD